MPILAPGIGTEKKRVARRQAHGRRVRPISRWYNGWVSDIPRSTTKSRRTRGTTSFVYPPVCLMSFRQPSNRVNNTAKVYSHSRLGRFDCDGVPTFWIHSPIRCDGSLEHIRFHNLCIRTAGSDAISVTEFGHSSVGISNIRQIRSVSARCCSGDGPSQSAGHSDSVF